MIGAKKGLAETLVTPVGVYYETMVLSMSAPAMKQLQEFIDARFYEAGSEVKNLCNDLRSRLQRIAKGDRQCPT